MALLWGLTSLHHQVETDASNVLHLSVQNGPWHRRLTLEHRYQKATWALTGSALNSSGAGSGRGMGGGLPCATSWDATLSSQAAISLHHASSCLTTASSCR